MQEQIYFTNVINGQNFELFKEVLDKKVKKKKRERDGCNQRAYVLLPLILFRNYEYIVNFRPIFLFYILRAKMI